ncbi:MAG TPA: peptidase M23, partial [Chromatiales bacterium]|nr:peptidase M23 [Chromatiales bacterium]
MATASSRMPNPRIPAKLRNLRPEPARGVSSTAVRPGVPRGVLIPLLALLLVAAPVQAAAGTEQERELRAAELERLQQQIRTLTRQRNQVRNRHDEIQQELRLTEQAISETVRELRKLDRQRARQKKELRRLQRQQQKLRAQLARQRELLAQQVRTAYMIGRQEYLKLLLNQEDPATLGRAMTYYRYFNAARLARIGEVNETLQELARVSAGIAEKTRTLDSLRETRLASKRSLETSFRKRKAVIVSLEREIRSRDQQLERLQQDEQHLQELLQAIETALPDDLAAPGSQSFARLRGKLGWPVKGKVRNLFGRSRYQGRLKWNGVMIEARAGNTVRAVARGRVAYADWLRGYGLLIIIDHGDGYMSLYGHNQSLYKEVGDWVEADEAIAGVGDSGGQSRPGLYFEIRHNG